MTAGSESRAAWMEQHYEKLLLIAVLVGLLASAAVLFVHITRSRQLLADSDRDVPPALQRPVQPPDFGPVEQARHILANPLTLGEAPRRIFMSGMRVLCIEPGCAKPIEYETERCPFCGTRQPEQETFSTVNDGIPDVWKAQYDLDLYDPHLARRDVDGDGFTVREEFEAGTSPIDPEDYPPIVYKLRVEEVRTTPFDFTFLSRQEVVDGDFRYQINQRSTGRTFFRRIGEAIDGYTIEAYDEANDMLVFRSGDRRTRLRRGVAVDDHQRVVHFVLLVDGSRIVTRAGQPFEVRDATYIVRDIAADGAVRVVEADRDEAHTVPRATEAELAELGHRAHDMLDPDVGMEHWTPDMLPPMRPYRQETPPPRVPDRRFRED